MKLPKLQRRTTLIAAGAMAMTLAGVLVAVNFMNGEKKIERRIERHHTLEDRASATNWAC